MALTIVLLVVILWLPRMIKIDFLSLDVFIFSNYSITLYHLLVFSMLVWMIALIPRSFRGIAIILVLLFGLLMAIFYLGFGTWVSLPNFQGIFEIKK